MAKKRYGLSLREYEVSDSGERDEDHAEALRVPSPAPSTDEDDAMQAEIDPPVARGVARGVEILDEKCPGWHDRINLARLNLEHHDDCVLGQLYRGYSNGQLAVGYKHYTWNWKTDGIYPFNNKESKPFWVAVIKARVGQGKATTIRHTDSSTGKVVTLTVFASEVEIETGESCRVTLLPHNPVERNEQ